MSIPFLKASHGQCRWIVDESQQAEQMLVRDGLRRARTVTVTSEVMVCGQPVKVGSWYCPCHHARAYVPKAIKAAGSSA